MIKVGIVGGTGYTGVELLRLLAQHPQVKLMAITSRKETGMPVSEMYPSLRGRVDLAFTDPASAPLAECDVVFFATPHGVAMAQAPELLAAGVKIIDLAADFRLKDTAEFERWYKMPHSCPDILAEAVYGLPEVNRDAIRKARVIGLPGCYPTSVQLGWLPVLDPKAVAAAGGDLVERSTLIADCKSGVSGAGRKAEVHVAGRGLGQLQGLRRGRPPACAGNRAGPGRDRRQTGEPSVHAPPCADDPRHPLHALRAAHAGRGRCRLPEALRGALCRRTFRRRDAGRLHARDPLGAGLEHGADRGAPAGRQ
jgi:hypothetical protein